jgi:hypothetical protein
MRNKIFVLLLVPLIVSCTPSAKERAIIIRSACNQILVTNGIQGLARLQIIQDTREKLREKPFLGTDGDFVTLLKRGYSCSKIIASDADYLMALDQESQKERSKLADRQAAKEVELAKALDWKNDVDQGLIKVKLVNLSADLDANGSNYLKSQGHYGGAISFKATLDVQYLPAIATEIESIRSPDLTLKLSGRSIEIPVCHFSNKDDKKINCGLGRGRRISKSQVDDWKSTLDRYSLGAPEEDYGTFSYQLNTRNFNTQKLIASDEAGYFDIEIGE